MHPEGQNLLLRKIAREKFERLETVWKGLDHPDRVKAFQQRVRQQMWELLGGRPQTACPLGATITGTIPADGYRIEKLYFQSLPDFFVTANLYIPEKLTAPAPAILCPVGHAPAAKAFPEYQRLFAHLVRRGFVVLAFDPLGQGERGPNYLVQYGDTGGNAHDAQGFQCFLTGRPLAFYFIWDAIRAIDYLVSRPEVDPDRLGCTGTSGGGMQTTFLAALDERITAAVPACNTGWPMDVFESWMQHPEGNFLDAFAEDGPNNVNLAIGAAPRAQLLVGAGEDQLSAAGMHQLFTRVKDVYRIFGAEDRIACTITVDHHGYPPVMQQTAGHFFIHHLSPRLDRVGLEREPSIFSAPDLWATPDGDVRHLAHSTNVHRLNLARKASPQTLTTDSLLDRLQKALLPVGTPTISCRLVSATLSDGLAFDVPGRLEQFHLMTEDGLSLQRINFYQPVQPSGHVLLFIRNYGYPQCGELIRRALSKNTAVITGELYATDHQRMLLAGLTPAGYYWMIWRKVLREIASIDSVGMTDLHLATWGTLAGVVGSALTADFLSSLKALTLIGSYISLADTLTDPDFMDPDVQCTPNCLNYIDLPQIWSVLDVQVTLANSKLPTSSTLRTADPQIILNHLRSFWGPLPKIQVLITPEDKSFNIL